jgi:glucose/arabinose dehydrogenase
VKVTPIGRFAEPVFVAAPLGDRRRLFLVEKRGQIRVLVDGRLQREPFLDLSAEVRSVGNEQGLLGLAFAPDYERSGLFYVYFTDQDENARLVEFRRSRSSENRADPASGRLVVHIEQPSGEHYAGMLLFDAEGYLLFGLGDGGLHRNREPMRAQWGDRLHGKILRIDPRARDAGAYGIPPDNPDLGAGWRPEIWAYGLRNPWRFWIDPETDDFYVGDVGEYVRESIDYSPAGGAAGANFGWPCFEGGLPSSVYGPENCPGAVPPLFEYAREGVNCAVVGGLVVRDRRLPGLAGRYLFADYCGGEVESLQVVAGKAVRRHLGLGRLPGLTSFGEDALGRVYVATLSGAVYRLDPRLTPPSPGKPVTDGRRIFVSSGCGGCHTLAAAGATGTVGPSLDVAKPSLAIVIERVTKGTAQMPSFKDVLSERQIESVAAFVVESTRPK